MGKRHADRRGAASQRRMEEELSSGGTGTATPRQGKGPTATAQPVRPTRPSSVPPDCLNSTVTLSSACLVGRFRKKAMCLACGRTV